MLQACRLSRLPPDGVIKVPLEVAWKLTRRLAGQEHQITDFRMSAEIIDCITSGQVGD